MHLTKRLPQGTVYSYFLSSPSGPSFQFLSSSTHTPLPRSEGTHPRTHSARKVLQSSLTKFTSSSPLKYKRCTLAYLRERNIDSVLHYLECQESISLHLCSIWIRFPSDHPLHYDCMLSRGRSLCLVNAPQVWIHLFPLLLSLLLCLYHALSIVCATRKNP
ncbi:hypothetical protein SODALDRAFT_49720 [Sodiomyces alkalinus F11]|uniref:Uncharacterized protein n=1 Tax=Sodiomyces alkalinus (strain CBS 110278 / VKM F-3762 / F11) TaxID=1314773 RepID=A0A3N2PMG0_SODAK|nr:hypothetical protein SODALDRAFT_49720 [Sodiomyces alkalinus F11]ROT35715.1 hypothetical protein SODALDRAFT_49720 [Sodiomyces alkalinus F11]